MNDKPETDLEQLRLGLIAALHAALSDCGSPAWLSCPRCGDARHADIERVMLVCVRCAGENEG